LFTALLIAMLIVVGATTAVGGGIAWSAHRRKQLERGGSAPPQLGSGGDVRASGERGLRDMRPGDIVQHGGRDWLVEGVLHYDEDGHRWATGRLVDVNDVRWLVVGMDRAGATGVRLLQDDKEIEVGGYPPEQIATAEKRYALERRGTATVKIVGDAGAIPGAKGLAPESVLRCRWWRYQAPGPDCVLIEQWGGDFRSLRGTSVPDGDIELMQGS
jgi:hypothetical protein